MIDKKNGNRAELLLAWYDEHKRSLPFRLEPVPYDIWISEIMLQQTRMETVIPYFNRFITELPKIRDLAEVQEERLMKLWEGLGYYSRARNLKKAAQVIMAEYDGRVPGTFQELVGLPGIGPYTAGAIASIAFGEKVPAVDGNVLRVFSRLEAYSGEISKAESRRFIQGAVLQDMPEGRPGDFNQAVMELGATICLPNGKPLCHRCPLEGSCAARKTGDPLRYPVLPVKKPRRIEEQTVLLVIRGDSFLIEKRPSRGLLAGLNQFPMRPGTLNRDEVEHWLKELGLTEYRLWEGQGSKHVFSHVEWDMTSFVVYAMPGRIGEDRPTVIAGKGRGQEWIPGHRLEDIALPTAFRPFREELRALLKENVHGKECKAVN